MQWEEIINLSDYKSIHVFCTCSISYLSIFVQQLLLERFLNRAAEGFQNLFTAVEDHFELCLAKCRTSSQVSSTEETNMNC